MTHDKDEVNERAKALVDMMLKEGKNVSPFSVAKRLGMSHTNLWKHYPELYEWVKAEKAKQKKAREVASKDAYIEKLEKTVEKLSRKDHQPVLDKKIEAIVTAKLCELYRAYDDVCKDIDDLKSLIDEGRVETGPWLKD